MIKFKTLLNLWFDGFFLFSRLSSRYTQRAAIGSLQAVPVVSISLIIVLTSLYFILYAKSLIKCLWLIATKWRKDWLSEIDNNLKLFENLKGKRREQKVQARVSSLIRTWCLKHFNLIVKITRTEIYTIVIQFACGYGHGYALSGI